MHVQHQKEIPPTTQKDPIDNHEICTFRKIIKNTQSFHYFPTTTAKKLTPTFCHCRFNQFAFCHCEPISYVQKFYLEKFKYKSKFATQPK